MKKIFVFALLTLSGCSAYNNKFDCPYGEGLGCASVSKVNRLIDQNRIDLDTDDTNDKPQKKRLHVYYGPNQLSQLIEID
jgi:hypothetical protein